MPRSKRCFVISPIGAQGTAIREHADDVFEFIIKPAVRGFGIQPIRSDHMSETGYISEQMFREILHADLCVAVLTGYNANVFYELAIAQCAARPVIVLIEEGQALPFDVKDLRAVTYKLQPISRVVKEKVFAKRMREQVRGILDNGCVAKGIFEEYDFPELRDEQQLRHMIQSAAPTPLEQGEDKQYLLPSGQKIVILTGDIKHQNNLDVDVIVSLENTFLQLARYFDASISGSVSGTLRYMDAKKSESGVIIEDSLHENLRRKIEEKKLTLPLPPGSVVATPTSQLRTDLGVSYLLHVAAMQGGVGDGYQMMDDVLDECVRNAFDRFGRLIEDHPEENLSSILFPMLGAATTTLESLDVARHLLNITVRKMENLPACRSTYLLAWLDSHRFAVHKAARELGLTEVEVPAGRDTLPEQHPVP